MLMGLLDIFPKSQTHKLGETCQIRIVITQHNLSLIVLKSIQEFLGVGHIYAKGIQNASELKINSLTQVNYFIEQFKEAQLQGAKALDYADFCKGVKLMNNKLHLTKEGIVELKILFAGMNDKRTKFENE